VPTKLWRVENHLIGEVEEFRSEYEMEAFLMSNQVLLVGTSEEDDAPRRLWSQLPIVKGSGERGRIDLVGLIAPETRGRWELRLFELKKAADAASVTQIREYLKGWDEASQTHRQARDYVKEFLREFIDESEASRLLGSPLGGTLVASRFDDDALVAALAQPRIAAVKITKFRGSAEFRGSSDSSFIVIEDIVGKAVQGKINLSWADDGISESDVVVANVPGLATRMAARPFGLSVGIPSQEPVPRKRLILLPDSASEIVKRKDEIAQRVRSFVKWNQERILKSLDEIAAQNEIPLYLVNATAIVFALANYQRQDFWVTPTAYWKFERSGETLWEIESRLKQA
jgi:hypothetical protein